MSAVEPLALTLDAAAKALSISPRTVRRLLDAGELTPVRIGRALRVSSASVRDFVERSEDAPGTSTRRAILPGSQHSGGAKCRTSGSGAHTGGSITPIRRGTELDALLEPKTGGKRKPSKPNGSSKHIGRSTGASNRADRSRI